MRIVTEGRLSSLEDGKIMADGKFVAYYRVSTDRQGRSGLGLEAQQAAVSGFIAEGTRKLVAAYTEVESGKDDDRPVLAEAMARARITRSTLIIAKLDRLSRDAHFLTGLQKSKVDFLCVDMPHANKMTIGIMAHIAEFEREQISARTKAALAAAKARGVKLGGFKGVVVDHRLGNAANRKEADNYALETGPIAVELRAKGLSYTQIAMELTNLDVRTLRKGAWGTSSVYMLLKRYRTLTTPSVPEPKTGARA